MNKPLSFPENPMHPYASPTRHLVPSALIADDCCAAAGESAPNVRVGQEVLAKSIADLADAASGLAAKIDPFLRPSAPACGQESARCLTARSEAADYLFGQADTIQRITAGLREAASRVDV